MQESVLYIVLALLCVVIYLLITQRKNKEEVKNKDLWTELDILANEFEISWNWVKAHSTDELNNEVDLIAKEAANL